MGCCTNHYKYEIEDYLKLSLETTKIRKLNTNELITILMENRKQSNTALTSVDPYANLNNNYKEDEITHDIFSENNESLFNQASLKNIKNSFSREKYQELINNSFLVTNRTDKSRNSHVRLQSTKKLNDFPDIFTFNKILLEKMYDKNKYKLAMNLFSLTKHESSSNKTDFNNSTRLFFKLIEGLLGETISYLDIKNILYQYITYSLVIPLEVVYLKTESQEIKFELRYLLDNEFNESQRLDFLVSVLKTFENSKLRMKYEDQIAIDSHIITIDEFLSIFGNANFWSWDLFELRELYLFKRVNLGGMIKSF